MVGIVNFHELRTSLQLLIEHPGIGPGMGHAGKFVEQHCDIDILNDRIAKIY